MTTQAPIKILSIDIFFVAMALMACRYWIRRAELAHRYKNMAEYVETNKDSKYKNRVR